MGKIIQFPGGGQERKREEVQRPGVNFRFTSVETIYDEEQVMIGRDGEEVTVADFKETMQGEGRMDVLRNFEDSLAEERAKYIEEQYKSPSARQEALVALAKHTYTVARRLDHRELMDWATAELTRGLGAQQAMIIIENIQIKDTLKPEER